VAYLEQPNIDGIINEEDESNGSSLAPPLNRPSHARRPRGQENSL
jgi:hypothetical protein